MINKILVVAAHPDDEILGCGGTIIEHIKKKDKVGIIIVSEGITARDDKRNYEKSKKKIIELSKISKKISKELKVSFIDFFSFPDNRLDSVNLLDIVKRIEDRVLNFKPNIVYTHHNNDLNIDHCLINKAVLTACRPYPNQSVEKILTFEIPSSTNWGDTSQNAFFVPNYYQEITNSLEKKIKYLKMYRDEMRDWPHARSLKAIESLAIHRGSTVGLKMAEAFQLVRNVKKFF